MRVPSSTPGGMLTESVRSLVMRPEPWQLWQGSSIVSPRPWQFGQVRSMVKKPWLARTLPWPPQVGQVVGLVPAWAPDARACFTGNAGRHADLRGLAGVGFDERDLEVVAQVGAALARGALALAAPAAHELAEQVVEDVGHRGGEVGPEAAAAAAAAVERGMPEVVVGRALLRVLQDLVGLVDLLEAQLGARVAGIAVGMEFLGEPPVSRLQLLLARAPGNARGSRSSRAWPCSSAGPSDSCTGRNSPEIGR